MAISDLVAAASQTRARKGPPCSVCEALASLPDSEAAALRALLADPTWRYQTLADLLREDEDHPLDLQPYTLSKHAAGRCSAREKLR